MFGKDLISIHDLSAEEVSSNFLPGHQAEGRPRRLRGLSRDDHGHDIREALPEDARELRGGHDPTRRPRHLPRALPTFQLGKRESVPDIARTLDRMVDIIMARTFAHESVTTLAEYADVPVINGLSDFIHPCQVLADFQTIYGSEGRAQRPHPGFRGRRQQRGPLPHVHAAPRRA